MAERDPDLVEQVRLSIFNTAPDGVLTIFTIPMTNEQTGDDGETSSFAVFHSLGGFGSRIMACKYTWNDGLSSVIAGDTISIWGTFFSSPVNMFLEAYTSANEITTTSRISATAIDAGFTTWTLTPDFIAQISNLGSGKFAVRIVSDITDLPSAGLFVFEAGADLTPPGGGQIVLATASIEGEASVGTQGQVIQAGSASIEAEADVSVTINQITSHSASLEAEADVSAAASVVISASASVDAEATVSAVASVVLSASASLEGEATVSAQTNQVISVAVTIEGDASMEAVGLSGGINFGIATINAEATVSATPNVVQSFTVSIEGGAEVTAITSQVIAGVALIEGDAAVSTIASQVISNVAVLSGEATVSAVVSQVLLRSASLLGGATVVASGGIGAEHTIDKLDEIVLGGAGLPSIYVYSDGTEYWILD